MKLTRQTVLERMENEVLVGKNEQNFSICAGTLCDNCELFNEKGSCKVVTDNIFQTVSRKLKLKKLLS